METLPQLRIGTSGWSYRHWQGVFYPPDVKPQHYLEYYASQFDCAELNASFYRLPKPQTVAGWLNRTPEHFRFCLKLSRLITHQKKLVNVEEPLAVFFERFRELIPKLGPILIQLPPGLRFDRKKGVAFFELLRTQYPQYAYALEARHESWLTEEALKLLETFGIAFVIADSGGRFPYKEAVTAPFVYLRFHGPQNLYASDYPEQMLQEFAQKIARWRSQGREVWAFFNNDVGGYAVKNAMMLRQLIQEISPE